MSTNLRRWAALVVVCFGQLMIVLDTTIVNVALGTMQRELHFTQADLTWVVNGYVIAFAGFLLVAGRMGDLFGRRKVFLAGILLFTVASFGTGLAQSAASLIVGRFLQGLGGSLAAGVILAIIVSEFTAPAERTRALAVFALVAAGGGSLGLLAGGALTQLVSWHWIFFINVPIGLATLVAGAALIRENRGAGLSQGIDVPGSLLIVGALIVGVYAIVTAADTGWTSAHTFGFGASAVALLAAFVVVEWRLANPLMPLRILRVRSLTGGSAARGFLFAGLSATFFAGSLYLQQIRGFDAIGIGLAFLPFTVALAALPASGVTARLMSRFGARNMVAFGLVTIVAALFALSGTDATSGYFPRLFVAFTLFGIGAGSSFLPLLSISMSQVPIHESGLATGFSNVVQQVGGALGLAIVGSIASARSSDLIASGNPVVPALTAGYQLAFLLAAISVAVGLAIVIAVLRSGRQEVQAKTVRGEVEEAEAA
jgi:EmrB/QacA subfamily drug resistance transporter